MPFTGMYHVPIEGCLNLEPKTLNLEDSQRVFYEHAVSML